MRPCRAAFDGGTRVKAPTIASAATGTLIRNVDDQPWFSRSAPATSGPAAMARPAVAVHRTMAFARSARGKVAASSDSVAGMIIAAPTPITARAAMTPVEESTSDPATEPAPKTTSPRTSAPRRLYLSPIAPSSSISAAYGTV
ncbi:hypothetical protein GCM10010273_61880 [Streptomyces lavendulocolor]